MKDKTYSGLFSDNFLGQLLSCTVLLLICFNTSFKVYEVPFTLHTFGVVLSSFLFCRRSVYSAMLLNIALKFGFYGLISPKFLGYYVGFFIVAEFINLFKVSGLNRYVTACAGSALILTAGMLWIAAIIDLPYAFSVGFLPFVIKDSVLACIAVKMSCWLVGGRS